MKLCTGELRSGKMGWVKPCALLVAVLVATTLARAQGSSESSAVPTLVNFSGKLTARSGEAQGVTFSLYKDQEGGSPLWIETQNVQADRNGHYTVMLGSGTPGGLPANVFASGEARWLGVQAQGEAEQPRVMLLAVPYALKAGDAQTVGGLPASAFALAPTGGTPSSSSASGGQSGGSDIGGSGTTGYLAAWTDNNGDLGNSILFQKGTGSNAKIGINEPSPLFTLDVNGTTLSRGLLEMATANYATKTKGYNSQPFNLESSAFNSSTNKYTLNHFQWQAEPVGNNTSNPSATLNLLYGTDPNNPTETGLDIAPNGQITFAAGQTFPGVGTITGITTGSGSGLTGGGTSGTLNLGLTTACSANQVLQWNGTAWVCATGVGGGTITGVVAGTDLTGGGTSGSVTLNLDTTKVPQLNAQNTFGGTQTITVNGGLGYALDVTQQAAAGENYAIVATNFSTGNRAAAVVGQDLAGSGIVFGVQGYIADNDGAGVFGQDGNPLSQTGGSLSGTFGSGVWGDGSTGGLGLVATADFNSAVFAENNSGSTVTLFAENLSPTGSAAIYGANTSATIGTVTAKNQNTSAGAIAPGIVGVSLAPEGMGVIGAGPVFSNNFDLTIGFNAIGVVGDSAAEDGIGVRGTVDSGAGVYGSSYQGVGVEGDTLGGKGSAGVYGYTIGTPNSVGVWGDDLSPAAGNTAVLGTTAVGVAVGGVSSGNVGYAGYFSADEGAYPFYAAGTPGNFCSINGNAQLNCTGGTAAVVELPDSRSVELYGVQSPEHWFEDFGSGQLSGGSTMIALEVMFAQTVNATDYHVFLTPKGDCKGLYVTNEDGRGFEVREMGGGKSNVAFDYRIVARRRAYENVRMQEVTETRSQGMEKGKLLAELAEHRPRTIVRPMNPKPGVQRQIPSAVPTNPGPRRNLASARSAVLPKSR